MNTNIDLNSLDLGILKSIMQAFEQELGSKAPTGVFVTDEASANDHTDMFEKSGQVDSADFRFIALQNALKNGEITLNININLQGSESEKAEDGDKTKENMFANFLAGMKSEGRVPNEKNLELTKQTEKAQSESTQKTDSSFLAAASAGCSASNIKNSVAEIDYRHEHIQEVKGTIESFESASTEALQALSGLVGEIESTAQKISDLKEQRDSIKDQISGLKDQLSALEANNEDGKNDKKIKKIKDKINKLKEKKEKIKEKIEAEKNKLQSLKDEARSQYSGVQIAKPSAAQCIETAQNDYAIAKEKLQFMKESYERLQAALESDPENEEIKAQLEECTAVMGDAEAKFGEMANVFTEIQSSATVINANAESANAIMSSIKNIKA